MRIQPPLKADAQPPEASKPRTGAFYGPTMATQSLTAFHSATGNANHGSSPAQVFTATAVVVAFVSMPLVRLSPGPPWQTRHGGNGIDHSFEDHGVEPVGAGNAQRQW
ncbi:hypothetical protein GCM10011289_15290 [Paludibacterium paludis]|uniref:Uncharacterized protein n=1 Tax=Paludibacterium paludis TaxID=1225769 RepID=A0A918P192_9NEIS|nr:hypothetical protein GCM10011289_15290 [Paludibacterium paludis]